jgi:spore maturation protein CgeB
MRVLIVHPGPLPDFSVHDVYIGWHDALKELGCEVAGFNLNDRLVFYSNALINTGETDEGGHPIVRSAMTQDQVYMAALQGISHALLTMWPDVVLLVSGFYMTAGYMQLMRSRKFRTVLLCTESPYQDDEQLVRAQLSDLVLLNDPTNLAKFRDVTRAEYVPHAYRPAVHYPRSGERDPALASDLCFIGTAFPSRVAFFENMDLAGLDVLIAGNEWGKLDPASPAARHVGTPLGEADCIDNPQTAELYRHARMGLNFYRREAEDTWTGEGWACGPREIEMAACGLPFLRDPRPESDELFGKILPTFSGPVDASEQLRWWLGRDYEREKIAVQARMAVADRTFLSNARWLLQLLDEL